MRYRLAVAALRVAYLPFRLLPRRHKVVVLSRQSDRPGEDLRLLVAALRRADPDLEVVVLTRMLRGGAVGGLRYLLHLLAQMPHVATARVLVLDTYSILASVLDHPDDLVVVQIWHALGAFKRFGLAALDTPLGPSRELAEGMRQHAGYDWVVASGPACVGPYAEAFGVRPEQVVVTPLPRVDLLTDPEWRVATRRAVLAAHPELEGRRVVVYAPTFARGASTTPMDAVARDRGAQDLLPPPPVGETRRLGELSEALGTRGLSLVHRPHPLEPEADTAGVVVGTRFTTLEWLSVAEVLVTDHSSVVFEAAVAGVRVVRFLPEGVTRLDRATSFLDWAHDGPGPEAETVAAVAELVADPSAGSVDLARFRAAYVADPEGGSAAEALATKVLGWVGDAERA